MVKAFSYLGLIFVLLKWKPPQHTRLLPREPTSIAILAGLAYGGSVPRDAIPTEGIDQLDARDVAYAAQLGFVVKLLAVAEAMPNGVAMPSGGGQAEQLLDVSATLVTRIQVRSAIVRVDQACLARQQKVLLLVGPDSTIFWLGHA